MSTRVLPDAESLVIDYLLSSDAAPLVANRIYDRSPEKVAYPFLIVRRIGGRPVTHHWLDHPVLEVTAWINRGQANGGAISRNICETAVAALHDMPGTLTSDAIVLSCVDQTGPRRIPDPDTQNIRYVAEVVLTLHPATEGS